MVRICFAYLTDLVYLDKLGIYRNWAQMKNTMHSDLR